MIKADLRNILEVIYTCNQPLSADELKLLKDTSNMHSMGLEIFGHRLEKIMELYKRVAQ